jgi:SAM-dependent methyltransferase
VRPICPQFHASRENDGMRREELFSRSGYYRFLLDSNALLHREAAEVATDGLASLLRARALEKPIKVLDLACGGWPVAIAGVMANFPRRTFEYTGVDINPDQVELASTGFEFPANVRAVRVLEGNAWDPEPLGLGPEYDLVFSGMNLHHGNPEELLYVAAQLRGLLVADGLFVSHDVYRPDAHAYRRRPDANPDDPAESFRLVYADRVAVAGIPPPDIPEDTTPGDPAWRTDYVERMGRTLIARGGDPQGTAGTLAHMRQRDYPVSTRELCEILGRAGFSARVRRFDDSAEPLGPYVACCIARLSRSQALV